MVVGMQVEIGRAYRTGADGATVRLASGAERDLLPDRLYEFGQPGELIAGSLMPVDIKQRHTYDDKQRHTYADKRR